MCDIATPTYTWYLIHERESEDRITTLITKSFNTDSSFLGGRSWLLSPLVLSIRSLRNRWYSIYSMHHIYVKLSTFLTCQEKLGCIICVRWGLWGLLLFLSPLRITYMGHLGQTSKKEQNWDWLFFDNIKIIRTTRGSQFSPKILWIYHCKGGQTVPVVASETEMGKSCYLVSNNQGTSFPPTILRCWRLSSHWSLDYHIIFSRKSDTSSATGWRLDVPSCKTENREDYTI